MNKLHSVVGLVLAASAGAGLMWLLDRDAPTVGKPIADTASEPAAVAAEAAPLEAAAEQPTGIYDYQARKRAFRDDYAALNAQRDGVVVLPSGVQYEVLEPGYGESPTATETVLVRYDAWLPDGRVFDSTEEEQMPLSLPLESIAIPGLREALLLMPEGAKWRVVIPPSQGFGRSGNNRLRRRDVIYDITLVSANATDSTTG